jgi:hypothetical protein
MTIPSLALTAMSIVCLFASNALAADSIAVPEPATATLMAVGAGGMYLLNRRRRK